MALCQERKFPDCQICEDIWRRFAMQGPTAVLNLGPFETAISSGCRRHTPLVERFREYVEPSDGLHGATKLSEDVGFDSSHSMNGSPCLYESVSELGLYWSLLLVKQNDVPSHIGKGRILDPDWADLDIVKRWKSACLSSHGTKCENPMKIPAIRPAWVIDTELKCVVSGEGHSQFVALSYRWGRDSGHRVNTDIRARLQKPGVLDTQEFSVYLPPIVRHAMYLTSVIGERFLWVDKLCITHGDDAATAEQLALMGAIYASAVVTIIAADGDAQDGLLGLRGVSAPRKLAQRVLPFGEENLVVRNTDTFSMTGGTEYYERAWTYQEFEMSRRRILFNQKELHWQCQCSVWHEEMVFGSELDEYINPRPGVLLAGFPDLGSFGHIVTTYNKRELTYDEDALSGIFGLLSILSRSFTGGCLYGLSEMFFDRALGWKPYWSHINLRRRIPSVRPHSSRLPSSALPSWSWIGWQDLISYGYGEASRINDRQSWIEETTPITEWYTSNSPSGSPRRRIRSTWYEDRDSFKDFTRPLPAGWTRHNVDPKDEQTVYGPRLWPDGCGGQVFKHCSMTDDDCDSWYYPFPVTNIEQSTPIFAPEQSPYLFCNTKKGRLWGYQAGDGNIVSLSTASGDNVGSLHLHNQEQLDTFPQKGVDSAGGKLVNLVAIYKSKIYSNTWDEKQEQYTYPQRTREIYEILWVEWKEEVAYRLASGSVGKDAWEDLDLADISLVLG